MITGNSAIIFFYLYQNKVISMEHDLRLRVHKPAKKQVPKSSSFERLNAEKQVLTGYTSHGLKL
jgi:hypothetical protein